MNQSDSDSEYSIQKNKDNNINKKNLKKNNNNKNKSKNSNNKK